MGVWGVLWPPTALRHAARTSPLSLVRAPAAAFPPPFPPNPGSKRDGISLRTLYRRAAGRAPTLLVVSDTAGGSFGAFTNEAWKVGPRYRGTGECFVFRLAPEPRIFRWSKLNSFFMLGQPDSIAVGAGGHFALWIDEELHRGTSGDCDTFRSKCLSTAADFEIAYVELWAFV